MGRRRKGARFQGPYKRANGRWVIKLVGPGVSAKSWSFETKGQAEARIRRGNKTLGLGETVENALDRYEMMLRTERKRESIAGMQVLRIRLTAYLDPEMQIASVTAETIQRGYEARVKTHSLYTVKAELQNIRAFCAWLQEEHPDRITAAELLKIGKVGSRLPVTRKLGRAKAQLTEDEGERFAASAYALSENESLWDKRRAAIGLLALLLGLRRAEILGLQGRDLDRRGTLLIVRGTKSVAAFRKLPIIDPRLTSLLLGLNRGSEQWLFPSMYNQEKASTAKVVNRSVATICELARVPVVTPHGLRGTYATNQIAGGIDPAIVSQLMGHARPGVTLGDYAQPGSALVGQAKIAQLRVIAGGAGQ